ncbi:Glutamate--cysteine ligase [Trichinella nativa]|uniref:Glutamate--cysteine ligase n=1 Tax=Trichinella nativa TaxID=6335 RepID=A0A0V1L3G4_9BILA|nr:Glutamate--cysteine ligase [Trichinella nativa]OUC49737.1 glutamate-cysteine ligase, catalytic subunit [Trichinella nativa]
MGLLAAGEPLEWSELKKYVEQVKLHGIKQFINLYKRLKDRQGDCLRWGDEIEYFVLKFDDEKRQVHVNLRSEQVLSTLIANESPEPRKNEFLWRPEYAKYMIEGTPGEPYSNIESFKSVQENMCKRRLEVEKYLLDDEALLTFGSFPRLGCPNFTYPSTEATPQSGYSRSLFFPDEAIFTGHPRFLNLTRNIRARRGSKVVINVPIFRDINTPKPFKEDFSAFGPAGIEANKNALPDHIYMDAMGFGMGCCCLQVTFQAVNLDEARWLYDQLTPITPIILALSASSPIFRGFLADVDSRWDVIAASVDDRTAEERGLEMLKENQFVLNKSRYDTTDCYIHQANESFNDIPVCCDLKIVKLLTGEGVDELLAKHIAHLFVRDPLQVFRERIEVDDMASSEHFETIQSSNWMNMRFKPPPADSNEIGWRVEFRPTEVQLTDFENAAFVCFVVLLTRAILSYGLCFVIPISLVNENMKRAQRRDAVREEKFYFRRILRTAVSKVEGKYTMKSDSSLPDEENIIEMSIDEIVNGKQGGFPGLAALVFQYLKSIGVTVETGCILHDYINFIRQRATGELWTLARWMREFVLNHSEYQKDSVVSESVCYDMMKMMRDISQGKCECPEINGIDSCYKRKFFHS